MMKMIIKECQEHLKNIHESAEMLTVTLLSVDCRIRNPDSSQYCKSCVNGTHTAPTDTHTEVQRHE